MDNNDRYRQAGVDIALGNEFVRRISPLVRSTHNSAVLTELGGFSGLYFLNPEKVANPVLVSSTDGVGTKLQVAFMMDKHDTVGIDLVAMCVNDIVVCGARPLFMLDYFASGKLELNVATAVIEGIVEGCRQARCSLMGGETAEMPGSYPPGEYDLAGFAVGIVDRNEILDGSKVSKGSAVVGLASTGLHSNGYSLARRIIFDQLKLKVNQKIDDLPDSIGETLLTPTRIYTEPALNLLRTFDVAALAHITGGGLLENIPRVIPNHCRAILHKGSWPTPPVFSFLQKAGNLTDREMWRTFNSGLGMVLVVPGDQAQDVILRLGTMDCPAFLVGEIEARDDGQEAVEII